MLEGGVVHHLDGALPEPLRGVQRNVVDLAAQIVLAQRGPRVGRVGVVGQDLHRQVIVMAAKRLRGGDSRGSAAYHDQAGRLHRGRIPAATCSHTGSGGTQ